MRPTVICMAISQAFGYFCVHESSIVPAATYILLQRTYRARGSDRRAQSRADLR